MSKGKKAPIQRITDFEETCMWMSYRYAIGRHSIGSVMHANDIAKNLFYRIPNDRKEFTAFDIVREITDHLSYPFNFYIDNRFSVGNINYHPFELFMEFLEEEDIHNLNDLNNYKSIHYDGHGFIKKMYPFVDAYHSSPIGDEQKEYYDNPHPRTISHMDIDDLIPWQMLSACFDVHNLKVIKTNFEGEELEHICFKTYFKHYGRKIEKDLQGNDYEINDLENVTYVEHWMDINSYLSGKENRYVSDEYIVSIRDITDEECKQFEAYV